MRKHLKRSEWTDFRRQRPLKGGRPQLSPSVETAVDAHVRATAARFHCSRSFVVNTMLAEAFGVSLKERYDTPEVVQRKRGKQ